MNLKRLYPIIVVFVASIALFDFFHPGLPLTHDGADHVARIANFYKNLEDGIFIPRWAPNLNWGYGHPILMFLYPLPSYAASFFHVLGSNFVDSTKLVFVVSYILSGLFMYLWLAEFLSAEAGFVGSVLYLFAPYRFVDMYVRGAIGEHVAFVFVPVVFYFLLKLSEEMKGKYILFGSLAIGGLILSHNAISIMFFPIIFVYLLFLSYFTKHKKKFIIVSGVTLFFGLLISAFFWLPAFFEGKYTLRDIVTSKDYFSRFVDFKDFLFGLWSYGGTGQFTVQVGIVQWIFVLLSFPTALYLYKKTKKNAVFLLGTLLIFTLSLFVMTNYSKVLWDKISVLQKFQFPWRFLSVSVFAASVLGALVTSCFSKKYLAFFVFGTVFLILFFNKDYWKAKAYLYKNESFYSRIYDGTTDTGESSPIWSVRFMEHRPKAHIEVIKGNATIEELRRTSTVHAYRITAGESARIRENTLYFPGWEVIIDKKPVTIEFQDELNRGLVTFSVEKGTHTIEMVFKETKLRILSEFISAAGIILLVMVSMISQEKLWQRFR